ncbi:ArnT family glycosyltransferase [Dictyobacter arantiisoli]|nr:glycosyltransferase family 39 protein [Dictyobacter arantiisoli]
MKLNRYSLAAFISIAFATVLRVVLVVMHWPPTNSDEGTMMIMAYNIAYKGERPLNFYQQDYMGTIEAYLGALLFRLTGGPSIMAMRFGVIFLTTLFFIAMYFFARLIFSKKMAIVTIALLSVGSIPYLTRQVIATGGSTQTLLFGTFAFFLASWLAMTYQRSLSFQVRLKRLPIYVLYGIVVGLGLWSDMIVLPVMAFATLLLLFFCWRELLVWGGWLCLIVGGLLGFLPSLLYNASIHKDPITTLLGLVHGTGSQSMLSMGALWINLVNTIQVSLPTATGLPFCPVNEYPFLGDNTPRTLQCGIIQSSWSFFYIALVVIGLVSLILAVRHLAKKRKILPEREFHQELVRLVTQVTLLLCWSGILLVYIYSSGPVSQPGYHARYLITLLISTPAVMSPLYRAASQLKSLATWQRLRLYGSRALLALLALILVIGTGIAFSEVPRTQAAELSRMDLVANLERIGVTRFYTDYWTCNNLMIASDRKLLCVSVKANLVEHGNRYPPYQQIVENTPNASWMCPKNRYLTIWEYDCLPALNKMMQMMPPGNYKRYEFDQYVIYKNIRPVAP